MRPRSRWWKQIIHQAFHWTNPAQRETVDNHRICLPPSNPNERTVNRTSGPGHQIPRRKEGNSSSSSLPTERLYVAVNHPWTEFQSVMDLSLREFIPEGLRSFMGSIISLKKVTAPNRVSACVCLWSKYSYLLFYHEKWKVWSTLGID